MDRDTVHESTVAAVQIADLELLPVPGDDAVLARERRITNREAVRRISPDGELAAIEGINRTFQRTISCHQPVVHTNAAQGLNQYTASNGTGASGTG